MRPASSAAIRSVRLSLLLCLAAASLDAAERDLVDVPHPRLDGMEAAVREQLEEARHRLDRLLEAEEIGATELGESFADLGQLYVVYDLAEAAMASLENAHRLLPGDARWPYLLGTLYEHQRRLDEAATWYERAIELEPSYLPTRLRLGDVRLLAGDLEAAQRLFRDVVQQAAESAYAHAGLGKVAFRRGRFDEAARHFERALELQPRATALHYQAAQAYRRLGEEEAMRRHLEQQGSGRVRFRDPVAQQAQQRVTGVGAELLLARMAMREGAVDVAEARVRRAIELDPSHPSARNNLGVVLEAQGRLDEAVAAYAEAVRLDPESVGRRFALARVLRSLGRDDEAIPHLRRILELVPEFVEGRTELASALARSGRLEEAESLLRRALEVEPGATGVRWQLVLVLDRQGRAEEAEGELERVLERWPDLAEAWFKRGNFAVAAGDSEAAIAHYRKAVELDSRLLEAHMNLAILLGRRGEFAEAARHQERVVELAPENASAHLTLATARILAGECIAARRDLEAARRHHPEDPRIADALARLLATAPEAAARDGVLALELAGQLFESSPSQQHAETLAMALAENGRFAEAVELQERVVAALEKREAGRALTAAGRRLERYRSGQPARAPWLEEEVGAE